MHSFPDLSCRSASLFERACKVLPGGNSRLTTFQLPYPIYAKSAEGMYIVDADGTERSDFLNNYTSLIHGHRHPAIVAAMTAQAERLDAVAMTTEVEIELAELLCGRIPSLDQIRFTNSGTEGVMQALRAARAYTGRPKIAKCEGAYHGAYDYAEPTYGMQRADFATPVPACVPYANGTPKGALNDVIIIPYNDPEAIEKLLAPHADQLAGLIIDLVPTSLGTISATREFAEAARRFTSAHGIILIFDEVVSFRIAAGGAQEVLGVRPDLTALGKIIGGGLPIGAVGGKREFMSVFDARRGRPALPHGGTFNANPITMAAGLAAMSSMTPAEYEHINRLGELARRELRNAIRATNIPCQVTGVGSLLHLHMHNRPITDYRSFYRSAEEVALQEQLYRYLLNHGILIAPHGLAALSTPMDQSAIDRLSETVLHALRMLSSEPAVSQDATGA
jgi:glutamate-1-semialdehyde 2,1-aminomutase